MHTLLAGHNRRYTNFDEILLSLGKPILLWHQSVQVSEVNIARRGYLETTGRESLFFSAMAPIL